MNNFLSQTRSVFYGSVPIGGHAPHTVSSLRVERSPSPLRAPLASAPAQILGRSSAVVSSPDADSRVPVPLRPLPPERIIRGRSPPTRGAYYVDSREHSPLSRPSPSGMPRYYADSREHSPLSRWSPLAMPRYMDSREHSPTQQDTLASTGLVPSRIAYGRLADPLAATAPPVIHSVPQRIARAPTQVAPALRFYPAPTPKEAIRSQRAKATQDLALRRAPYVCEFFGTFALTLTVGCCAIYGDKTWNATAVALCLMAAIYATGPISGGCLNPAVSVAFGCLGKLRWSTVVGYVVVQIIAGLAAGRLCGVMAGRSVPLGPLPPFAWIHVLLIQGIYTTMLCLIASICTPKVCHPIEWERPEDGVARDQFSALAIGFVVIAGGYAAGEISGNVYFNPAVAIGMKFTNPKDGIGEGFLCALIGIIAGILSSFLVHICCIPEIRDHAESSNTQDHHLRFLDRAATEFLGAFLLALTVGLNVVLRTGVMPWSSGAALLSLTYSLDRCSDSGFNPAVLLAASLCGFGKGSLSESFAYAFVQILAALSAGVLVSYLHSVGPTAGTRFGLGPGESYLWGTTAVAEISFTCFLAYTIIVATTFRRVRREKASRLLALMSGGCLASAGLAIQAVTGGALNPAVALSIASEDVLFMSGKIALPPAELEGLPNHHFSDGVSLACFELVGGFLAAAIFHTTHLRELRKTIVRVGSPQASLLVD